MSHCGMHEQHDEQVSVGTCRRCGTECCASCLVYSFGESKAPFCPPCALAVAGLDAIEPPALGADATAELALGTR